MARELKEKDDASRSSQVQKHVYHNTPRADNVHSQYYGNKSHFSAGCSTMQQPAFSQGYAQTPFAWQHPMYQPYQQVPQYLVQSTAVSSPVQPDQQQSSQPQQAKQDNMQDQQTVNSILPSRGHIFATTGGSNQEHESQRARRDYEWRVHIVSPRFTFKQARMVASPNYFRQKMTSKYEIIHTTMLSSQ
jgi:hypothetical protein